MSEVTIDPNSPSPTAASAPTAAAPQLSEETLRLATLGRGEAPPEPPPATGPAVKERPADIPEKFWDAEKGEIRVDALLKSYTELEKFKGGAPEPKGDEPPAGDQPADPSVTDPVDPPAGIAPELFSDAAAEFSNTGDLSEETREKIIAGGIPPELLDTYLAGVKALSEQLTARVYELSGGQERYAAAVEWAKTNWTPAQIEKYNASLNDPDLRDIAVKGLLAAAVLPAGEGQLTFPAGGAATGDLYHDKEEFTRDLAEADAKNDTLARRAAVAKLERSKKAGTLKHVTPRSGLRRFG
ncbi:hypothetical protein [Novosphingobium meiothermophilum]|uniref:hypothetical protein n=1 Tax=Novosphingobium meiothermophilum TaxID=2202251 RepID=UPI000D6E4449|nr:hypothetical protein [Novosphingobium meiothermophilum]